VDVDRGPDREVAAARPGLCPPLQPLDMTATASSTADIRPKGQPQANPMVPHGTRSPDRSGFRTAHAYPEGSTPHTGFLPGGAKPTPATPR
jgi:hypothetical protein